MTQYYCSTCGSECALRRDDEMADCKECGKPARAVPWSFGIAPIVYGEDNKPGYYCDICDDYQPLWDENGDTGDQVFPERCPHYLDHDGHDVFTLAGMTHELHAIMHRLVTEGHAIIPDLRVVYSTGICAQGENAGRYFAHCVSTRAPMAKQFRSMDGEPFNERRDAAMWCVLDAIERLAAKPKPEEVKA